jgi:hypothetical protein
MDIQEAIDLVKGNIQEDALSREAVMRIKRTTPERVEKQKGGEIQLRKMGNVGPEEKAEKYVNRMTKGHIDSKGKKHEYDSGKILKGLGPTYKGMADEAKGATPRFNIFKKLAQRGELTRATIRKSTILSPGEKEILYDIIEKGK